jgi:GR25 family glycosyltransferase involved in LPS biosynthesis
MVVSIREIRRAFDDEHLEEGMRIFAINLHRSTERRHAMLQWLPNCDLPWEIFEALDASLLRMDAVAWTNDRWGASLWPGAVGCFFSHLHILRRIIDYDLPWAVVLEDDVFPVRLPPRFADLPLPSMFDVVYLHEMRDPYLCSTVIERGDAFHRVRPAMLTTGAYAVSRAFAEQFCEAFEQVEMPVDHAYRNLSIWEDTFFFEQAEPMFRLNGNFPSTINLPNLDAH